ncbi:hypothetical protein [Tautonia plasticadhaerens]|uniref:Uncharacterized protein n=1 Tax=Tautonia plasticadhaerens TaxID=2527974 RepID=A0A518GXS1_9BACT|nr:hypothetical protein [Tautonia plasticadhaerens]QDV33363.1 hypothetical protein ElP_12340 [Tautonia plasticadhaerens]
MADNDSTPRGGAEFDFEAYPDDTCFHERRTPPPDAKPVKKERRRRIDPTTFEKQYSRDELEFMNAMQRYKMRTGKAFPSYGEVLEVAKRIGYEKTGETSDIPGIG